MQQIQSLFCFQGRDHGNRFAVISGAAFIGLFLFSLLFHRIPGLLVVFAGVLGVICAATANRRVRDTGLGKHWMVYSPAIFALCTGVGLFGEHLSGLLVWLLAIPAILILFSKPSEQALTYIQGYHGPIDLAAAGGEQNTGAQYANRIEPTFVAGQDEHYLTPEQAQIDPAAVNINPEPSLPDAPMVDPLASIKALISEHQKPLLGVSVVVGLLVIVGVTYPLWSNPAEPQQAEVEAPSAAQTQAVTLREHLLEMPSNDYFLLLDENKGLIIHWPSYDGDDPALWSILTAKGELSCEQLKFNDKRAIRANKVTVENGGDYYASFSPLDTEALVSGIADKNSFSLCGYDFSLKGTRAVISQSSVYSQFLR